MIMSIDGRMKHTARLIFNPRIMHTGWSYLQWEMVFFNKIISPINGSYCWSCYPFDGGFNVNLSQEWEMTAASVWISRMRLHLQLFFFCQNKCEILELMCYLSYWNHIWFFILAYSTYFLSIIMIRPRDFLIYVCTYLVY